VLYDHIFYFFLLQKLKAIQHLKTVFLLFLVHVLAPKEKHWGITEKVFTDRLSFNNVKAVKETLT